MKSQYRVVVIGGGVVGASVLYHLARTKLFESEFAGSTFAPDGSTLFVNIQTPGLTVAITGPWNSLSRGSS